MFEFGREISGEAISLPFAGIGGGYCDRDDVEYIDREESDDEIDDVSALYRW